ncbi:hypothetical protein [Methylocucumis oryzae]|uniref:H-type lectin domain-containing protein n=1 Tax=Methylocucumis oryzae TaxID=1632867 RepID=A0A0F3IL94_9GAMM|nr:hypothetical protein [Methylocucumis oryzae]KJV07491.1 hypothetical protein VZ94_04355 [Methylocucumis oryzae]
MLKAVKLLIILGLSLNFTGVSADTTLATKTKAIGKGVRANEQSYIISGKINSDGTILLGTGFDVVHNSEGHYTVYFDAPFSREPIVTLGAYPYVHAATNNAGLSSKNRSSFTVFVTTPDSNSWLDVDWEFIAVGPRQN